MIGYKVVRVVGEGIYAPISQLWWRAFRYKIDAITTRMYNEIKMGPFAVFGELNDAKAYRRAYFDLMHHDIKVLKVEYELSCETELYYITREIKRRMCICDCPYGTVLAEWVKPLEEVQI